MKILICGSRNWTDTWPIFEVIDNLSSGSILITGGCRGADLIAQELAEERKEIKHDLDIEVFYAKWDIYGKRAGPMRNLEMLEQKPDIVYAFPLDDSKGTYFTTGEAKKRGICTIIYGEK